MIVAAMCAALSDRRFLLAKSNRQATLATATPAVFRRGVRSNRTKTNAMSTTITVEVLTPAQRFQQLLQLQETAANMAIATAKGVQILGPVDGPEQAKILSVEAQNFVAILHRCFNSRRKELLARRVTRQYEIDAGVGLGEQHPYEIIHRISPILEYLVCACCVRCSCCIPSKCLEKLVISLSLP